MRVSSKRVFLARNAYRVLQTKKKGRGVFVCKMMKKGTVIGDYLGKLIRYEKVSVEDYPFLMYFSDKMGLVADKNRDGVHLLNHSCDPNCLMVPYKGHILFATIRDIKPGEELTASYMYHPDACKRCNHECFCGSANCVKTMHTPKVKYRKYRAYFEQEKAKTKSEVKTSGNYLLPLNNYPTKVTTLQNLKQHPSCLPVPCVLCDARSLHKSLEDHS